MKKNKKTMPKSVVFQVGNEHLEKLERIKAEFEAMYSREFSRSEVLRLAISIVAEMCIYQPEETLRLTLEDGSSLMIGGVNEYGWAAGERKNS